MLRGELTQRNIIKNEDGYYIIRQPMPYVLGESNAYLIESSDGWSLIDVGVDVPENRVLWQQVLSEIGITFQHIKNIYITHCHPDHLGAARWLQQMSAANVYMLQEEIERACRFIFIDREGFEDTFHHTIIHECNRHGFSPVMINDLVTDWYREVTPLFPQPEELKPLLEEKQIDLGGSPFEIIKTGGHSDGQYVLWSARKKHMFGGDMLAVGSYLHFTDWPLTGDANTLATLFAAMERLKDLGEVRVFPGHGNSFTDLGRRLEDLKQLHLRRMGRVLKAVKVPVRAGDLYPQIAEVIDHVHLHRLVLGETLGYLSYLTAQGQLRSYEDPEGLWFYP